MTLEQIDSDLREWDQKLRIASDNMLELSNSMSYQRLLGEGHWPKVELKGATADRCGRPSRTCTRFPGPTIR